MTRARIHAIALGVALSLLALGGGVAWADRVVIEPPVFVPEAEFHHENGYYRTHEGHYYHYDSDRNGWHYGRNHDEGVRFERERESHRHR